MDLKRLFALLLASVLAFGVMACGSGPAADDSVPESEQVTSVELPEPEAEPEPDPEVEPEPEQELTEEELQAQKYQELAGTYLLVELTYQGQDMSDAIKSGFEDRRFYEYIVITDDGTITLFTYQDGQQDQTDTFGFTYDFENSQIVDSVDEVFDVDGDRLILDVEEGRMVFEKTDEEF